MGMKQIYNIMVGMALMLGATSCEEEILDNGQAAGIALADGQFIVDYSGEVTTRAIKDNAEKGERINSLTYLLYMQQADDYVLQKRREIPGLNKTDDAGNPVYESWPLTRDNMTWEQREALKDTLLVGSNYRAVFVANADASLWGGTSPLVNASMPTDGSAAPSYSSAYLQLPANLAFNDGNMFYLAEAEIDGAGKDRETPYNCPITLKRVVTRTDWWFERLPKYDETNTEVNWKQTEEVKAYSTAMLNSVLAESWNFILESINEETASFLDAMIGYFEAKGKDLNNEGTLTSPYDSYVAALTTMKGGLSASNYVSNLLSANNGQLSTDLFEELRVACLSNTEIQEAWKASWRKDEYSARLVYNSSSAGGADKLYLDRRAEGTTTESSLMSIDSQEENTLDGYTYDGFHFVGLANPELNQVSQVIISDANNTETTINVSADVHTGQGINERYGIYYRPIAELGLKDNWNSSGTTEAIIISKKIICNLATALPFAEDGSQDNLKRAMEEAMADGTATGLQGYGTSLNSITLTISLPNLANTAVLKITDSWNMRKID